jgi:hypothetical protein
MKQHALSLLACLYAVYATPTAALSLQFDYSLDTAGFFTPARRAVLETAGATLSTLVTDTLSAISSSGINQFTANLTHPGTLSQISLPGFSVPADTLHVFVGGNPTLGSGTLGFGGPGGFQVSGTSAFVANAVSRGQVGPTTGALATEFAPWGGVVTFNSALNWYADPDPFTVEPFTGHDLYSVALHELGHVLGLGVSASWFRLVSGGVFTGAASIAAFGNAVPLTTAGDHWAEGTRSGDREALMDPTLQVGTRKTLTPLDVAALDDIGWNVEPPAPSPPSPVEVPLPPAMLVALAFGLLLAARAALAQTRTFANCQGSLGSISSANNSPRW